MDDETYEREKEHCLHKHRYRENRDECVAEVETRRKQITCCEGYVKVGEDECKGKGLKSKSGVH